MGKAGGGGGGGMGGGGASGSMPGMSSAGSQGQAAQAGKAAGATPETTRQAFPPDQAKAAESAKQAQAGKSLETGSKEQTPQWKGGSTGTPAQETQKAGETLQNRGVTTNATQSPETKAQLQSTLDKSAKDGQNTPRADAARQTAKDAPKPETPSPTMQK